MESEFGFWSYLAAGAIALMVLFFFGRGIGPALERSKNAPKDWPGVLIPIAVVVLFVLFLISIV